MICIILTCVFLVLYFLFKIFELHILKWEARTRDGNHHCNYCECAFFIAKRDRERTHCPYCGRILTKHKNNPDYVPLQEDEPQKEIPFDEFKE